MTRKLPLLVRTFAILALVLMGLPAMATAAVAPTPILTDAPPAPVFLNGPPEAFPGRGNSCRLPPPFRDDNCACPFNYLPVCGCDHQTYSNDCVALCFVRSFTDGACEGD